MSRIADTALLVEATAIFTLAFIGLDTATTTAAKLGITAVATLAGIALLASIIAAHTGREAGE